MRSHLLLGRVLVALLTATACLGALASTAEAHASFLSATPTPGQRLANSPGRVVLVFSEPLNAPLTHVEIRVDGGGTVPARQRVTGRRRVVLAPRSPLSHGAYRVQWRTVSTEDGHPLEGSFGFGVRVEAVGGRALQESPLARGGWVRVPARGALYAALLVFAGALLTQGLLGGGHGSWLVPASLRRRAGAVGIDPDAVTARARGLVVDTGVLALGLAALVAAIEAFTAAGRISVQALPDFLTAGPAGPARLGVITFAGVAVALAARRPRLAALAAASALACVTASGHADSAQPRALALVADLVHLIAGAVWLGGTAILVATWWPALRRAGAPARREVAANVLPAFGSVALPAFVVVVVTGTISALIELGHPGDLWESAYGAVLSVKVLLVAAIAALGYVHARRLRPRILAGNPHPPRQTERAHWGLLRAEPALGLVVVAAAGLLVAFPLPPRQVDEAKSLATAVAACDPCPLPTPAPDQLAVAELGGSQVVAGYLRRRGDALDGTIRLLDYRGRPAPGPIRVAGAAMSPCGRGCLRFRRQRAGPTIAVRAMQRGRTYEVALPARWRPGGSAPARRLLERAQRTMRGLTSVRELELVTSGPGTAATTAYRLRAPDRLAYRTDRGVQSVQISDRQWLKLPDAPWRRRDDLNGGVAFTTRSWFSWTPYARSVQLLGVRREGRRALAELALMDPGTPVWIRLLVDVRTGRVARERLVARSRLVIHRFWGFGAPVTVSAPARALR